MYGTVAFRAAAACARGAVELSDGDTGRAVATLRSGWQLWREAGAPYEAARARALLAKALDANADGKAAALELDAARSAFERLGAKPDAELAAHLAEKIRPAARRWGASR